ncbi:MAG: Bax inhibitor-1/YccA family protein [Marmoricola sp.]
MQSRNPVFARSDEFNGRANAYGNQTYPGNGSAYAGYGDPSTWSVGGAGTSTPSRGGTGTVASSGPMTIDSVVQKTGITMLVVVLAAAATWVLTGDVTVDAQARSTVYGLSMAGALLGFVLSMVNSFKRVISPALVLAYAVCEGVFVGAMSKVFEAQFPGIVVGAVIGTFAAVAGTLAAYKFFDIKVTDKFRKGVTAVMLGFVALVFLDFVLGFFHASFGINGFGTMGLIFSVLGLALGVLMLVLDFDYVERGVAAGLPERESWRAAFGLAVTIIWLYIEILRILAILRGND